MNCSLSRQQVRRVSVVLLLLVGLSIAPASVIGTQQSEPGDSQANATGISSGETVTGTIPGDADEDWYAIEMEQGETINVTTAISGAGNIKYDIVGPDGNTVTGFRGGSGDGTFYGGTTAQQSGTYYVRVYYWFGDEAGDYSLTVETYATTDDEPNENRDGATDLATGEQVQGEISVGDTDWYAVDVQRGQTINMTADLGPGGGLEFNIVDPDGETVGGAGGSAAVITGGTTARQSGTYYVEVLKDAGNVGAGYSLVVDTYGTTDTEPNEAPSIATNLTLNASVEDTLSVGDVDWYAFDLERGDSINVSGTVTGAGGIDFRLKYENRSTFGGQGNAASGRYAFNATAPYTGTYLVAVQQSSAPGPDYTLAVQSDGASAVTTGGEADGGDSEGDDTDEDDGSDGQQGSGPPVLSVSVAVALAVVVIALVMWWREDDDEDDRQHGG